MNKKALAAIVAAPFILAGAGCSTSSLSSHSVPSFHASAIAAVPGFTNGKADGKKILIDAGVPVNGTSMQQIEFVKSLKSKANRKALAVKLGIPPQKRDAFWAAVLTDMKNDHVSTHAGREKFITDLENTVGQYAG